MSTTSAPESAFKIAVSDSALELLREKLAVARFPDELQHTGWKYGVPLEDLRRLVKRWKDGYDWRTAEAKLNEMPQFTRDIEVEGHGVLNVHYVHQKSNVVGAIPLLFVHGWPGSFIEVRKLLPLLTAPPPGQPAFHVVALSLPGFGFSQAPSKPGFKLAQYAELANKLMLSLGYNRYVTQGGDWGTMVTRSIAELYGGMHGMAWHINGPIGFPPKPTQPLAYISHMLGWYTTRAGYMHIQSTKPQTLGYGMTDSPVGLLAWIYEKLVDWTDAYEWDDDEALTWISIYWFSRAGPTASFRMYYECIPESLVPRAGYKRPTIPLGVSRFPKELMDHPDSWIKNAGNLVFTVSHDKGGHFAAYEEPQALVEDLRRMLGKGGVAYGVVEGLDGYGLSAKL